MNIYRELIRREDIQEYYKKGDEILSTLGYTDHSTVHASIVASKAAEVLSWFHYPDHLLGLARAAGYLHDIGNAPSPITTNRPARPSIRFPPR